MSSIENDGSSLNAVRLYRADGTPRPVGVIGYPVKHSLSPVFQNVAFEANNLPHRYEKWEVAPAELPAFLEKARREDFLGLNVTLPHKRAVWEAVSARSQEAEATGAVNTLLLDEASGGWLGHNTDVGGFLESLQALDFNPLKKRALVVGAGGAARGVVYALASAGAVEIAVANRSWENAIELVSQLGAIFPQTHMYATPLDPAAWPFNRNPRSLVVNATSQGILEPDKPFPIDPDAMAGRDADRHTVFYDLTYGDTPFLRTARDKAAYLVDGLGMLVYQGAEAFEWWTGLNAPRSAMLEAARAALAAREAQQV
ncbi:MAG TPA: shikimate dehydrogenase [Chloroflexia bacterium]|nr:shikimate dehydrogenase [Chloroflexia bacterium]